MKSKSRIKAEKLIENIKKQKEVKIDDWSTDSHDHELGCFYILDVDEDTNIRITVQETTEFYSITLNAISDSITKLTLFKSHDNYFGHNLKSETENMIMALKEKGLGYLLEGVD